jgi:geranylgeranylglycerol-phosphate geranylgeranyltransferase
MGAGITEKIRACAELIRLDLAFGAGFFTVAGEVFAVGGPPPAVLAIAGFIALFCISGSANISNDYFDREVDRVNLPSRPLPSGRISAGELWALFFAVSAAGLAAAALLGPLVFVLVIVFWGIALLYNIRLKEFGLAGNLVVASCVAMTVLLGGLAAGAVTGLVLTFAALAFLFDLGEEIVSDAMDMKGDQIRSSESLAKRKGRQSAIRTAGALFGIFFVLVFLPFLTGWLGYWYLFIAAAADLWMVWCVMNLVRDPATENGRLQVRRLYLAWGVFVVAVVICLVL